MTGIPESRPSSVSASVRWSVADAPGAPGASRLDVQNPTPGTCAWVWRACPESAGVDGPLGERTVAGPPYRCSRAPETGARAPPFDRGYAAGVPPRPHRWRPASALLRAPVAYLLACLLASCGSSASFDPAGPCVIDGKAAGAYPALEALVPRQLDGRPPTRVDSGRSCSDAALGPLKSHGGTDLRFGGATWDLEHGRAVTIAVLALPDRALPFAWAEEFYELSARAAKRTGNVEVSQPTVAGVGAAFEVDTLNDLSYQTVIVWPDGDNARVVLVATPVDPAASLADHRALLADALAVAAGG